MINHPNRSKKPVVSDEAVTTYKGFNANLQCHGDFQFEIGKTYEHGGTVKVCEGGFHACEDPLDVLGYYPPAGSRFALVKQSGDLSRHGDDSKIASRSITIEAEISLRNLLDAGFKFRFDRVDWKKAETVTGEREGAVTSGTRGAASATGDSGAASATGYSGAASATGDSGAASATGDSGAASATGTRGAASATGYRGAASATGDSGAASATGYRGAASATGDRGAASATGTSGAASATGTSGAASATGTSGAAMASGRFGRAQGANGCAIFLVHRDENWNNVHAWAGIVGQNGIKPETWYTLDESGNPQEMK